MLRDTIHKAMYVLVENELRSATNSCAYYDVCMETEHSIDPGRINEAFKSEIRPVLARILKIH